MKVLSISDKVVDFIYSPTVKERFGDVDFCISCGDLPYYYVEYVFNALCVPMFFVRGNHASKVEFGSAGNRKAPQGGIDIHRRIIDHEGLIMAGIEGSVRYNRGPFQYTQGEMWQHVLSLAPSLMINRMSRGRFLDIFIAHSPAYGIHDKKDPAHVGIKAFRWLLDVFKPAYFIHGHIHIYHSAEPTDTLYGETRVINTYGYKTLQLEIPDAG